MDMDTILRAIDAEIEKLQRVREILTEFLAPVPEKRQKARVRRSASRRTVDPAPAEITPPLTVLPPKTKRQYSPRRRTILKSSNALAPALFDRPVFVPAAALSVRSEIPSTTPLNPAQMEAALRKSLLETVL